LWNALLAVSLPNTNGITIIPVDNKVDTQIQKLLQDYEVPSLAVGIAINDSLVWTKGYGQQPSLDTVYILGSILKPFIATSLLQLAEDGLLDLQDDVNNYLPFELRHPDYPADPITIQMCLSHRSSLTEFPDEHRLRHSDNVLISWVKDTLDWDVDPWEVLTLEEYLVQIVQPNITKSTLWMPNKPGTTYKYSNFGLQVLMPYVIENITGESYEQYIVDNTFTPLEMTNSGFNGSDFAANHAKAYLRFNDINQEFPQEYYLGDYSVGYLRGTVSDLANFMIAHMNQGKYKDFQLLTPESIELMHTKYTSWVYQGVNWAYGLGWEGKFGGHGHGGATPGFIAEFLINDDTNRSFGIVYSFNRGSSWVQDEDLLNEFQPSLRTLLFEEAARMSSPSTVADSPGFSLIFSILVVISLIIWYKKHLK